MTATINTRFEIGQTVFVPTIGLGGKVLCGKVHMIRAEWCPYGFSILYDVTFEGEYIKDWPEDKVFATEEEATAACK